MGRLSSFASMMYTALLFAPFGFWILGIIFGLKAIKTRDFGLFKQEIRKMFYQS